jgi:PAS domain S-box-containing protein
MAPENRQTAPVETTAAAAPWEARAFAALPVPVFFCQGEIIAWANEALCTTLRYRPEELMGRNCAILLEDRDIPRVRQRWEARQRGDQAPEAYEVTLLRGDGTRLHAEVEPRIVGPDETLVMVRDLGERLHDSALLGALGEVAVRVQRARSVAAVLEVAAEGLHAIGFQVLVLRLAGPQGHAIEARITETLRTSVESLLGGRLEELRFSTSGLTLPQALLEEGRFLFADDAEPVVAACLGRSGTAIPAHTGRVLQEAGSAKLVLAPLIVHGGTWGLLVLGAPRLRSNDAAALSLFAAQVASALEVADSIADLERQNRKLEALRRIARLGSEISLEDLVPRLLEIATQATDSDAGCILLLDTEQGVLNMAGAVGYPEELRRQCTRLPVASSAAGVSAIPFEPRPLSAEDLPEEVRAGMAFAGLASTAVIPLVANGRVAGTVNLSRRRPRPYDAQELLSASQLVAQIALQLEGARLHADARRRVEDLALINEVGGVIAQHLELEEVLSTAMEHLSRIVEVPHTFLLLLDPSGVRMHALATNLPGPDKPDLSLSVHEPSAAAEAVRTRKAVVVEDTSVDPRVSPNLSKRFGHRALLAVPLLSEGRPVGAMVMGETRGPRRFSRWEVDRALALANQLASAIDKARLYDEQRLRVRHLRLLLENSQVITGSLELEQILAASAQGLVRMVDATDAFIWFLEDTELRGVVCSSKEFQEHFSQLRISLSEGSAVGLAIQDRAPVRIEDAESSPEIDGSIDSMYGQKSVLALPLMLREVPIGAISIGDRRRTRRFTDDEVERTLLMSRQVAVAIDNARLFQDLKRSYTELSRAQQELVKRERLAALGELSAVVAHEVRNPLGVIFNSLASLRRRGPQDEDARMLLSIVGEEAERLNRMVSDLLDFARPHVPQLQPESLGDILRGAVEAAARAMPAAQVKVAVDVSAELPPVPVDAEMLRQAMVNLVMNAMQAIPRGGEVTVRARPEARGVTRYARVEVQDNGPGIAPEHADLVFQPFFTTKAAGTGLGLAVVKRIADAHRAELAVRSAPGGGSTFILWLPA